MDRMSVIRTTVPSVPCIAAGRCTYTCFPCSAICAKGPGGGSGPTECAQEAGGWGAAGRLIGGCGI